MALALSERGRATINLLHLDRPVLEAARREALGSIEVLWRAIEVAKKIQPFPTDDVTEFCRCIVRYSEMSTPYSAAVRQALRSRLGANTEFPLNLQALLSRV